MTFNQPAFIFIVLLNCISSLLRNAFQASSLAHGPLFHLHLQTTGPILIKLDIKHVLVKGKENSGSLMEGHSSLEGEKIISY